MTQTVDILIASFEGSPVSVLQSCLESIRKNTDIDHECIVVRSLKSAAKNRNQCLQKSKSSLVCFLDDDVHVHPGWLTKLVATYCSLDKPASLAPLVLMENGNIFSAGVTRSRNSGYYPLAFNSAVESVKSITHKVDLLPTTCMLLQRESALTIGGFDENFQGSQWEDIDFAERLAERGCQFFVDPLITVTHRNLFRESKYATNEKYFEEKWKQK